MAIAFLAHGCGAPKGQKDLAKFTQGLSQAQRRALGVRQQSEGYPAPAQELFQKLDWDKHKGRNFAAKRRRTR